MCFFGRNKTVSQVVVTRRSTDHKHEHEHEHEPAKKHEESKILAVFQLDKAITVSIVQGSLVDFNCPGHGAIVNATNERCIAGGGIDGAITNAGGPRLSKDRGAIGSFNGIRCPMGQARITGPGYYGSLKVNYVIHAVGPNYKSYEGNHDFESLDNLLRSAYQDALECCRATPEIEQVAFALLSAGVFRGKRGLRNVLQIGIKGIRDWASESDDCGSLKQIFLFAFKLQEADVLLDICKQELKQI
jgi:O-acetyl-ADP-ribose deacetylase (regulator of RNase III)